MANELKSEKKVLAISMLAEGNSIRSIERMTGIHSDTVMRLGVRIGEGCQRIMDEKLRNLNCGLIEVDEVWGFISMKQKTAHRLHVAGEGVCDVWTWIAIDAAVLFRAGLVAGKLFDHGDFLAENGFPSGPI
jgi:hypothetical protein